MSTSQSIDSEVTSDNFENVLPLVEEALRTCDYVALDAEFTGLHMEPPRREEVFDNLEQRYAKTRLSAQRFIIMQFGLSMVEWDASRRCNVARTFNFYIFPRPFGSFDLRFTSQASSIDFLRRHNFDFNKFVYKGVPYLSLEQLEREQRGLEPRTQSREPIVLTRPNEVAFMAAQMQQVREWVQATQPLPGVSASALLNNSDTEQKPPMLMLEPTNSFLRAATYRQLDLEFKKEAFYADRLAMPDGERGDVGIALTRATPEQIQVHEEKVAQDKRLVLQRAAGFGLVLQALTRCRKPVIGHNMLMDLAYLYQQFVRPLPPTLNEFRTELVRLFPGGLVDTKHLARQFPRIFLDGTSLEHVFITVTQDLPAQADDVAASGAIPMDEDLHVSTGGKQPSNENDSTKPIVMLVDLSEAKLALEEGQGPSEGDVELQLTEVALPRIVHALGFDRYRSLPPGANMAHEAGYDAFMTAAAFAGLAQLLSARLNPASSVEVKKPSVGAVKPLANRINIMRSDMEYLPLMGSLPKPDRSNVLLLYDFPKEVNTSSILEACRALGLGEPRLIWLDQMSAYVVLQDSHQVAIAIEELPRALQGRTRASPFDQVFHESSRRATDVRERREGPEGRAAKIAKLNDGQGSVPVLSPEAEPGSDDKEQVNASRCTVM